MAPRRLTRVPVSLPLSILIVEAHDGMRAALRDWLLTSFPPLRLREARNMDEALSHAEQAPPDLVIVDFELPGSNGIEFARTLRRRLPACEVVLMSVHESEALRIAALEAGASAYIAQRELPGSLSPIVHRLFKNEPLSPKTDIRPI